jgi:drug/metabolite transporter (DMT)-like permease
VNTPSLIRLFVLAAIWGGSFLCMRIAAPVLGPGWLVASRAGLAAVTLLGVAVWVRRGLDVRTHWRHYLILGAFNVALPFLLFGYAAATLSASLLAIVNATSPIWGALIAAATGREPLTRRAVVGLVLGVAGVALLVGVDHSMLRPGAGWAVVATLGAALCYGIASTYARSARSVVQPLANAHGSMWAAVLLITPVLPWLPLRGTPGPLVFGAVVALGVACTAIAYLLYYRLIADVGGASALSVTFLVPGFGLLWAHLFLGEPVGWSTLGGAAVVLVGTALVTGFVPRWGRAAAH